MKLFGYWLTAVALWAGFTSMVMIACAGIGAVVLAPVWVPFFLWWVSR